MPIRNQNWYNANESRRYPLDDQSTGLDDAGVEIRDNVLADCDIRFSSELGGCLYVQGITVSRGLVSVVFGAAADSEQLTGHTVAAVTVERPVTKYRHYDITPLAPGIDGWVVFGSGIEEDCQFRFTQPRQSIVATRCADAYSPLPIPSMKKVGVGSALADVITFEGLTPIKITHEKIKPDPENDAEVDALVFRLDTQQITLDYNPLSEFLSPCGGRPDSGTCGKEPVETINGVEPDCNGNIVIEFGEPLTSTGIGAAGFSGQCGGLAVDLDISLATLCNSLATKRPQEYVDKCCAIVDRNGNSVPQDSILVFSSVVAFPAVGVAGKAYLAFDTNLLYRFVTADDGDGSYVQIVDAPIDPFCWPMIDNVDPDLVDNPDLNLTQYACIELPPCIDFIQCTNPSALFVVEAGAAEVSETIAPPPCPYCDGGLPTGGNHGVLNTSSVGSANVYAIKKCRTDWFINRLFSAEFQIPYVDPTYERIAGLVFNYYYEQNNFRVVTRYFAVVLNRDAGAVQVWGYTGNEFVNLSTVSVPTAGFVDDDWFEIQAKVTRNDTGPGTLEWRLRSVASPVDGSTAVDAELAFGVTIIPALYFTKYGLHGLYSRRSFANFNKLKVGEFGI